MKIKSSMWFLFCAIAVDNSGGDNIWVVRIFASDGDSPAIKVDIAIAVTGIFIWADHDDIAIDGGINCGLDVIEISVAIVIDVDGFWVSSSGEG
jgi:hypothetical protein